METVTEGGKPKQLVRNMSNFDPIQKRSQGGDSVPTSASNLVGPGGEQHQARKAIFKPLGPVASEDYQSGTRSFREDSQISGSVAKFVTDPGQMKNYFNYLSGRYLETANGLGMDAN